MFGYINSVRDRQYKLCTPEIFDQLVNSPMVVTHIEEYRKGNEKSKSLLPAFLFQGYNPNVLLGKKGSRLAKALQPTGFFIMDFDHISSLTPNPSPRGEGEKVTPGKLYDRFLAAMPKLGLTLEDDFALAHITPSGDGLRLVLRSRKNRDVAEDQKWIADALGVECDVHVKDLSRLSFVPQASDILYINKQLLFRPLSNSLPEWRESEQVTIEDSVANETNEKIPLAFQGESRREGLYPSTYNGIPYRRIVEELIAAHGGEPQVGNRNNMLFLMASDLAKITDRSAAWMEQLLPTFGLPESEWRQTIAQVCKKPMECGLSRKLQEAIKRCSKEANLTNSLALRGEGRGEGLPPALPDMLPPLLELFASRVMPYQRAAVCNMVMPALAAHVNNCKFRFADGKSRELALMGVLLGASSVGKSCIDAPIEAIMADVAKADAVGRLRLKEWRHKQNSKKANEKGEPHPEVPIRILSKDVTRAAFLQRLYGAQYGDPSRPNLCLYSDVSEIEGLYKFGVSNSRVDVADVIKQSFDRKEDGSERSTAAAVDCKATVRWNFTACSTIAGGQKFFRGRLLTDGTVGRVDFSTIITPEFTPEDYYEKEYDREAREQLKAYIQNLEDYRCVLDEENQPVPAVIPEILELEQGLNFRIRLNLDGGASQAYRSYVWRTKLTALFKGIVLYIAHGCRWSKEIEDFVRWAFEYGMWCKMGLFGDAAEQEFGVENIVGRSGQQSPLLYLPIEFTLEEYKKVYYEKGGKGDPKKTLAVNKSRGLVIYLDDGRYRLSPKFLTARK